MTSFITDDGDYIDYDGEIALTKQAVSFFNFKIVGDISVSFDLPNTSVVRRVLGYYGHGQNDSPAYSRTPVDMVRNGNKIARGHIVIESSTSEVISGYFLSGNGNWFDALKFNIKDIDFTDYVVDMNAHDSRKTVSDGITFPVVDWAMYGQKA